MSPTVQWLMWAFGGAGASLLPVVPTLLRRTRDRRENLRWLAVHAQPIDFTARGPLESYDHALAILIRNDHPEATVEIQRAGFDPSTPRLRSAQVRDTLPIYPTAFRHSETDLYELKFGDLWQEPRVTIGPGERIMTYLPLSGPAAWTTGRRRKVGRVVLDYRTAERFGTHRVSIFAPGVG